jgi:hypothetical protein
MKQLVSLETEHEAVQLQQSVAGSARLQPGEVQEGLAVLAFWSEEDGAGGRWTAPRRSCSWIPESSGCTSPTSATSTGCRWAACNAVHRRPQVNFLCRLAPEAWLAPQRSRGDLPGARHRGAALAGGRPARAGQSGPDPWCLKDPNYTCAIITCAIVFEFVFVCVVGAKLFVYSGASTPSTALDQSAEGEAERAAARGGDPDRGRRHGLPVGPTVWAAKGGQRPEGGQIC